MPGTTSLTIRLPDEMADALRTYAFLNETSVNDTVKRAVVDYLQQHGRADVMRAAFEKVLADHAVALDKLKDL